jgi:tRNA (guanine37-N1)-methyltransferase
LIDVLFRVLTIFPEMFAGPLENSILKRAQDQGLLEVELINIRDYSTDKHCKVDDYPFGGGAGMLMKPEPFFNCFDALNIRSGDRVILMTPQGETFTQEKALELSKEAEITLICGHYEGIDERVKPLVTDEISLGDFVLTGGEIASMAIIDCVGRLLPGTVGDANSLQEESFNFGLLEYPHYTRPRSFQGWDVPDILLSGNHQEIRRWRRAMAIARTFFRRPDLLVGVPWEEDDRNTIDQILSAVP